MTRIWVEGVADLSPSCMLTSSGSQWVGKEVGLTLLDPALCCWGRGSPNHDSTWPVDSHEVLTNRMLEGETAGLGVRVGLDLLSVLILGNCLHHDSACWPQFPVLPMPPNQPQCICSELRIPAGQTLPQLSFSISVLSWAISTGDATSAHAQPSFWTLISSPSSLGDPSSENSSFLHVASLCYDLVPFQRFAIVQSPSCVWFLVTPWTAAHQASLSFTVSQSLLKLTFIELVMPSNHLILSHLLLLLPSIFPSIRVFPSELAVHIRWLYFLVREMCMLISLC